jgi:cytoskeletal protein RodZ
MALTPEKLRRMWALLMALVVTMAFVGVAGLNSWYTRRVSDHAEERVLQVYQDSQRKQQDSHAALCSLFMALDNPAPPPTTERGKEIQKRIHAVRLIECGGK